MWMGIEPFHKILDLKKFQYGNSNFNSSLKLVIFVLFNDRNYSKRVYII